MRQIHPKAEDRLREMARERAKQYDSHILHNTIHDGLPEDDCLRHVAHVMAEAYELEGESSIRKDERDDVHDRIGQTAFECGDGLSEELENLADDVEVGLLERAADELSQEWYDEDEIKLAKEELPESVMEAER